MKLLLVDTAGDSQELDKVVDFVGFTDEGAPAVVMHTFQKDDRKIYAIAVAGDKDFEKLLEQTLNIKASPVVRFRTEKEDAL